MLLAALAALVCMRGHQAEEAGAGLAPLHGYRGEEKAGEEGVKDADTVHRAARVERQRVAAVAAIAAVVAVASVAPAASVVAGDALVAAVVARAAA